MSLLSESSIRRIARNRRRLVSQGTKEITRVDFLISKCGYQEPVSAPNFCNSTRVTLLLCHNRS
jgi:hypothetical protein